MKASTQTLELTNSKLMLFHSRKFALDIRRHRNTIVVVAILLLINLVALNWTWKYFTAPGNNSLLRFGDRIPSLDGRDYSGRQTVAINPSERNLLLYLSGPELNGRAISLLKAGERLQRERETTGLRFSVITAGPLREIQELLQDKLITYNVINDQEGTLAKRLGLAAGDNATFLFDKKGLCRFSTHQQISQEDLHQLLTAEGLDSAGNLSAPRSEMAKGKPLPPWRLIDVRTLEQTTADRVAQRRPRTWVFFPVDCFSCGAPVMGRYLQEFNYWVKAGGPQDAEPILVFDSAFMRGVVVHALNYSKIASQAFIADEELSAVSRLAQSRGKDVGRLMIVRTEASGAVSRISMIKPPASSSATAEAEIARGSEQLISSVGLLKSLENPAVDVYDVDSFKDRYVVSDRTRNSILILDQRAEIVKEISGIGSAPDRVFRPGYLDVAADGVIYVQDGGNDRIQSFDLEGRHLGGFFTSQYTGFAAGSGGEVYLGQPEQGSLVTVYSREGKRLRSFGSLKSFSDVYGPDYSSKNETYSTAINRVKLTVDGEGNILVSFMLAPIIQKYTRRGELVFERRLEGPEIDRLTAMLVSDSSEGYLTMTIDGFPERVIALEATALPDGEIDVVLIDGSIYVADRDGHRLRVVHPQAASGFMPDMVGTSPNGEVMLVGLAPRDCYRLPRAIEQAPTTNAGE